MIVVDASVILHLIADGAAEPVFLEKVRSFGQLFAPHLIDLEVMNALRRQRQTGIYPPSRIDEAIADFNALTISLQPTAHLNSRIWALCHNLTPYDASYVALAEFLEFPLVSRDAKMARSPLHRANIIII